MPGVQVKKFLIRKVKEKSIEVSTELTYNT